tara:strand:- start:432 stop:989 length:558 start_codon:yes stop_codon:yes gene_type:complete
MNKGTKAIIGLLGILGVTAVAAYFLRQAKLLKEICVSSTNFDWVSNLVSILQAITNPEDGQVLNLDYSITLVNNSNIDVELKEINLELRSSQGRIAVIRNDFVEVLARKSTKTIPLDIMLALDSNISIVDLIADQAIGGIEMQIIGDIVVKASIFETIRVPYRSRFNTGSNTNAQEESGSCYSDF